MMVKSKSQMTSIRYFRPIRLLSHTCIGIPSPPPPNSAALWPFCERVLAGAGPGVGVWLVRVNYNADNCDSRSLPSLYLVRNRARSRRNLRENGHR